MGTPFRIAPQTLTGSSVPELLAYLNKSIRDLRRDVVKLPLVLYVPDDITSNFGTTQDITMISATIRGGLISPPARGIRLEAYGQVQNHSGATATVEIHAIWGGVTASVITATLDDVGASTTVRHLNYNLDLSQSRTITDIASAGQGARRFNDDYLERGADLTGNADSPRGIYSFWVKRNGTGAQQRFWTSQPSGGGTETFSHYLDDSGSIVLLGRDSVVGIVLQHHTAPLTDTASWHHYLAAWNLSSTLAVDVYLDDVRASSTVTTATILTGTIDYTQTNHYIGAFISSNSATQYITASLSELYVNFADFLDLTVQANRRLFIDASGDPVDLGANGQTPTGNMPILFINTFGSGNAGYGGHPSIVGSLDFVPGPSAASGSGTGQVYRGQLQVSNVTTNSPGPAEDTLIDRKTFFSTSSGPDIEADQVLQIVGRNSAAAASTGIDIFRARIDLV